MFCLTLDNNHLEKIKKFEYVPVGLGEGNFTEEWLTDKSGNDIIAKKNPYYGEYTFHYWIWKNYISEIKNNLVGFCQDIIMDRKLLVVLCYH